LNITNEHSYIAFMDDLTLEEKIKSKNKVAVNKAVSYIYSNWRPTILKDIEYQLKDSDYKIYAEDIFNLGLEVFRKNLVENKWKGGSLKAYLRTPCIFKSIDLIRHGPKVLGEKSRISPKPNLALLPLLLKKVGFNCTAIIWLRLNFYSYKKIALIVGYTSKSAKTKSSKCMKRFLNTIETDSSFKEYYISNSIISDES